MSILHKILIALGAIVISGLLVFIAYREFTRNSKLEAIETSMVAQKQLLDNISRAQAQYASREDIESFAKHQNIDLDVVKKDLELLHAEVKGINAITINSVGQTSSNVPSTAVTPRPDSPEIAPEQNPFGYLTNKQELALNEKFSNIEVPFGKIGFSAWQDKPWSIDIAPRKYSLTSILGVNQDGRHYTYSKFAITSGDKTYDVQIDDNKFLEEYPSDQMFWWNPRLGLFVNGGIDITQSPMRAKMTPGVGISISSYGKTRTQPALTFLELGLGAGINYGNKPTTLEFTLAPIKYNLGSSGKIPLITNLGIGPVIQVNTFGQFTAGAGLTVGL